MKPFFRWLVTQPVLVNICFVGVLLYGIAVAIPNIPVDRYPNVQFGEVHITTPWPGASINEVERLVTKPLEEALRDLENVEYVSAQSLPGRSEMHIKFLDDTDYQALEDDLRLRVSQAQNRLPVVNGKPLSPIVSVIDVDEWLPVIQVNLVSAQHEQPLSLRALVLLAEDLRSRLELIDGIKEVSLLGDQPQQFDLALDPQRLRDEGLTIDAVAAALRSHGQSRPAGTLQHTARETAIELDSRFYTREDLLAVPVRQEGGGLLRVADLVDQAASGVSTQPDTVRLRINGLNSVACKILKQHDADANRLKAAVVAAVDAWLKGRAADGVSAVYTLDSTIQISESISTLLSSLIGGSVLVAGTLLVFLNFRAGFLTLLGVAFSFVGCLVFFQWTGYSLNELSLLGFVLVVGIIVDDAIIVLENIQRRREDGEALLDAVINGTTEVFWPVVSATLTSVASFLPMLVMTGSVGEFFSLIPIAVCTALLISLVECMLILPLHVIDLERILGPARIRHASETAAVDSSAYTSREGFIGGMHRFYDRLLRWHLAHPILTLSMVGGLLLLSVGVLWYSSKAPEWQQKPLIRFVFFPDDATQMMVRVELPSGSTINQTEELVTSLAQRLLERGPGEISATTSFAGMSIDSAYKPVFANQVGFVQAELATGAARQYADANTLIGTIRNDLEQALTGRNIWLEVGAMQGGPPTGLPITVRVTGSDSAMVKRLADDLVAWIDQESRLRSRAPLRAEQLSEAAIPPERVQPDGTVAQLTWAEAQRLRGVEEAPDLIAGPMAGTVSLTHNFLRQTTVAAFVPNLDDIARLGLSESQVLDQVSWFFDGAFVGELRRSDDDIPIRLRLSPAQLTSPQAVLDQPLLLQGPRLVRFSDVGRIVERQEPAELPRRDFQRSVTISADIAEGAVLTAGAAQNLIRAWYTERQTQYPGATIAFGGEAESTGKSYRSLVIALGLAVFLIYGILATQFRSYLQPLLIMSNIVFSFTGVILTMGALGLAVAFSGDLIREERTWFTVHSFIAVVGLTGLVVNDAIVLIDFINSRLREGLPLRQALTLAGHQRMRAIFMTTITTIAGLLPMALGIPSFSVTWTPFASCFVAGLCLSTSMTLLVIPVLYECYAKLLGEARLARLFQEQNLSPAVETAP